MQTFCCPHNSIKRSFTHSSNMFMLYKVILILYNYVSVVCFCFSITVVYNKTFFSNYRMSFLLKMKGFVEFVKKFKQKLIENKGNDILYLQFDW